MRRRDFNIGLLIAGALMQPLQAQETAKQYRIAIVTVLGARENISEAGSGFWRAFFQELRRMGHFEGGDLMVDRYSADGHPGRYTDLAREVIYQATKFEFVINLKTAGALGLTLPQSLLALADEVIE